MNIYKIKFQKKKLRVEICYECTTKFGEGACIPLRGNSFYALFIQLNFDTLVKGSVEIFLHHCT